MEDRAIKASFTVGCNENVPGVRLSKDPKHFSCWSSEPIMVLEGSNIYGVSHEPKVNFISLLHCLGKDAQYSFGKSRKYTCDIYSHIMITGPAHISPGTDKFNAISLAISNPKLAFVNSDNFGYIHPSKENLIDALNEHEDDEVSFSNDKRAVLAYFTGKNELFTQDTELGLIMARNSISYGGAPPISGVHIKNDVVITIEFSEPLFLDEAFKRANKLAFFIRCISGQGLSFKDITLRQDYSESSSTFNVIHDNYNWGRRHEEDSFYRGPLIDMTTTNFLQVLQNWFLSEERDNARYSFYSSYFDTNYSPARLITTANMFDIFPAASGDKVKLDESTQEFLRGFKKDIKEKLKTDRSTRDSLLQAIGYVDRRSLKDKIIERLEIIKNRILEQGINYESMVKTVGLAIKARNYFVHGGEPKGLTPDQIFDSQVLFTDTLNYIYIMSELIEAGFQTDSVIFKHGYHRIRHFEYEFPGEYRRLEPTK